MGLFFTKKFYCCLVVFASFFANAQTSFTAAVTPSRAGIGEYVTLKLTVFNGEGIREIRPPSLKDFTIVSGPNQESEMSSTNGVMRQSIALSYVLMPRKAGNCSLGCASAVVGAKTYRSNPVNVLVTKNRTPGGQQQNIPPAILQMPFAGMDPFARAEPDNAFEDYILRKGESVPEKVSRNMQLRLETNKTSCFVGEPVLAVYKLYSRLRSESSLSKNPSLNGFSVIDMTQNDPTAHTREMLNGREFNAYTIRRAQLYPLQAGAVTLEAATLDNRIEFYKPTGGNAYQSGDVMTENVSLSSKPLIITVKPLPEAGKPAGFNGAVGNFNIETSLKSNTFSTDESGKLLITISGRGNMQMLTAPEVKWPAGLEAFDAKFTDNTDKTTVPLSGTKTFEIPFAAEKAGNYSTPAVVFSYFDPATAVYKTVTAPPIKFSVTKGTGRLPAFAAKETKEAPSLLNQIFSKRWPIVLLLAGILISAVIFWMGRDKKTAEPESLSETVLPAAENTDEPVTAFTEQNPLAQTEDCLLKEECAEFYAVMNGEVRQFLSRKYSVPPESWNLKSLAIAMDRAGVDNEAVLQTQQLLRDIEWQIYTPFEHDEKLHEMYARAQTILQLLNKNNA